MYIRQENIKLPEGYFDVKLQYFTEDDRRALFNIYNHWRSLNKMLKSISSRSVNLPEGLSEGAFALEMKAPRIVGSISGANSSFDCYDTTKAERIQVKACSVLPDLTSFGPKSQWDKIYFCDFYKDGNWDGTFDIYLLPNDMIYQHKVNESQTFYEQQLQKRRPRFSLYKDLITTNNILPIKTGDLSKCLQN